MKKKSTSFYTNCSDTGKKSFFLGRISNFSQVRYLRNQAKLLFSSGIYSCIFCRHIFLQQKQTLHPVGNRLSSIQATIGVGKMEALLLTLFSGLPWFQEDSFMVPGNQSYFLHSKKELLLLPKRIKKEENLRRITSHQSPRELLPLSEFSNQTKCTHWLCFSKPILLMNKVAPVYS